MSNQQNKSRRYIAKVKQFNGQNGPFQKILVDNPNPLNEDQTPNKYHTGVLLWCDNETGKKYLVKSLSLGNVSQNASQRGFVQSVSIDLESEYDVQNLG